MLNYFLLEIFIFISVVYVLIRRRHRPKNFPPGPLSIPIVGNLHQLGSEPFKTFMKMSETYGGIFAIDFASYRGVVLNDYKLIKKCLSDAAFSGRPSLRPFLERGGGKRRGIFFTQETAWKEQRRFVIKNLRDFGFGRKSMEAMIQEDVQALVELLKKDVGKPVSTKNAFNAAVVNSLWKICVGEKLELTDATTVKLVDSITSAFNESKAAGAFYFFPTLSKLAPELTGYNKFMSMNAVGIQMIREKFDEHKLSYTVGSNRDLIDAYWEEIQKATNPHSSFFGVDGELNMQFSLLDLLIAGAESTSTVLSWTFLLLALNPEIQETLYSEIQKVIGNSRMPELRDASSMPYTECLTLEVMRFCAIVPLAVLHSTTEDVMVEGYLIPKNTLVMPNLYAAMHDPVWGDPSNFRPERFLLANGTVNRHHEAHMVFSAGKRACLGESLARDELFLFTTTLFQHFQVCTDPLQPKPTLDYYCGPVLAPKYHELILRERN